jgi:hypothetical protein
MRRDDAMTAAPSPHSHSARQGMSVDLVVFERGHVPFLLVPLALHGSESVLASVYESVYGSVYEGVYESFSESVSEIVSTTSPSSLCDRKIGPGIAVHCAGVVCCAELKNHTTCTVDLMLMAET